MITIRTLYCHHHRHTHRMFKVDEAEANERDDLEAERDEKLAQLKERLASEVTTATDEMEKKHAYRLEQARQRLADEHEQVCLLHLIIPTVMSMYRCLHLARLSTSSPDRLAWEEVKRNNIVRWCRISSSFFPLLLTPTFIWGSMYPG